MQHSLQRAPMLDRLPAELDLQVSADGADGAGALPSPCGCRDVDDYDVAGLGRSGGNTSQLMASGRDINRPQLNFASDLALAR
jgi:hypothetical protein